MREILFRAQRIDNGKWVEGDLIHGVGYEKGNMFILPIKQNLAYLEGCHPLNGYQVIPESVCQFTGLTDKNGTNIFEGDIVESPEYGYGCPKCEVDFDDIIYAGVESYIDDDKIEVIGNVFDNPYLLK